MHVLFDFDGTLVDSFYCTVEKTILLADEFKFRKIQDHEIESLRELSSKEVMKFLEIPFYQIPQLIYHMRKHLRNEIPKLPPVAQICPTLEALHQANCSLGILTSNSVENVTLWLELHKMRHFFDFIHTESHYFSKKTLLKKTLTRYQIDKTQTFYVGDETRDIDAAHKNQIQSIAVTWGYNSEKTLLQYQPSFIVKKPEDILAICLTH